jgi:hypothetical protein
MKFMLFSLLYDIRSAGFSPISYWYFRRTSPSRINMVLGHICGDAVYVCVCVCVWGVER